MDEREHEYLKQRIRELEQAKSRWKTAAIALFAAFVVFVVLGSGSLGVHGLFTMRTQVMRAREAEMEARMQAEVARDAEMQAKKAFEEFNKEKATKPTEKADEKVKAPSQP